MLVYVSITGYLFALLVLIGIVYREHKRHSVRKRVTRILAIDESRTDKTITKERVKGIVREDRAQIKSDEEDNAKQYPELKLIDIIVKAKIKLQDKRFLDFIEETETRLNIALNYDLGKGIINHDNK